MIRCRQMEATMRFDSLKELKGEAFRRLTGVQRSTFEAMAGLLFAAKRRPKAAGGKPNTLSSEDQLLRRLEYIFSSRASLRDQRKRGLPQHPMGRNHAGQKQILSLPGRKAVAASDRAFDIGLIAATETPIERPKKQRRSSAGKNKRHTLKTQLLPCPGRRFHRILCIARPVSAW